MFYSKVKFASEAYLNGDYSSALSAYRQLAEEIGEKYFRANIILCREKLQSIGRRDCSHLPLHLLKVACITDEFTYQSFKYECLLYQLTPTNALQELEEFQPDLLFVESAWLGKDGLWERKIGSLSSELRAVLDWCKNNQVATAFWNKEDPVHFSGFLNVATKFDNVFTTDIDCIAQYKAALEHERVYLLPFACQPKIHNPIEKYERKDAFCFAGAYYVRYPERTRDLEDYVTSLVEFKSFEIFDRNFHKSDPNYQFPEEYRQFIVGTLDFEEIDKAYKGYRYAINLNSIKQSQSMFARRVFELLGSNTLTISNFSRGVRVFFGDLVISSDQGTQVVRRLKELDIENEKKIKLKALRKVMEQHTYKNRLSYIAKKSIGWKLEDQGPRILLIGKFQGSDELDHILRSYERQTYPYKTLVLTGPRDLGQVALDSGIENVILVSEEVAKNSCLHEWSEPNGWITALFPDDYYGANYLTDLALATKYGEFDCIGKGSHFFNAAGSVRLANGDSAYQRNILIPLRAAIVRADSVSADHTLSSWLEETASKSVRGLAVDEFNYCKSGSTLNDAGRRHVDDFTMDSGLSFEEIIKSSESISPSEVLDIDVRKWDASKLFGLVQSNDPRVKIELKGQCVVMSSRLSDGEHVYLYAAPAIPITELGFSGLVAHSFIDATPGLNLQCVLVFLSASREKLGHFIGAANKNHTIDIPDNTTFFRFGWRVASSGESHVRSVLWEHRTLEPGALLSKSDTLLITNNYPDYTDLYRNAFVHSRVRAYKRKGILVDVFRFRLGEMVQYHEFMNADVVTGGHEALHGLLKGGAIKRIMVHFLSPELWDILKDYPSLPIFVWVHGAEIQAWHRRAHNYSDDRGLNRAKREHQARSEFWRELIESDRKNVHFIFVSRSFLQEVIEDLGVAISDSKCSVIPNPIDVDLFNYEYKDPEKRKKILSLRPYASRTYANDLSVLAIQALSQEPFFNELEFRMIGDGPLFDEVLEPISDYSNVKIERQFLTQPEIAALHKEYGIFLVPTRADTQGVSRDEAMSSGLVPITNAVGAIPEFVDMRSGVVVPEEDWHGIANGIRYLFDNPDEFLRMSEKASKNVRRSRSVDIIINKELSVVFGSSRVSDDPKFIE